MLRSKYRTQYIPEDIVFDGEIYVDFQGHKFAIHPNLPLLKEMFVGQCNKEIAVSNESCMKCWCELIGSVKLDAVVELPASY